MSEHSRDEELLKAFLSGDSELSRRYRETARDEPPAHVDAAIIASARWAVGAHQAGSRGAGVEHNRSGQNSSDRNSSDQNRSDQGDAGQARVDTLANVARVRSGHAGKATGSRHNVIVRWRVPLATAAVVVIAATLTLMIERSPESDHDQSGNDIALLDDLGRTESTGQAPEAVTAKPTAPARSAPAEESVKTEPTKTEAAKRQAASQQMAKQTATIQAPPKPAPPVSTTPAAPVSTTPAAPASTARTAPAQSLAANEQPGKRNEAERIASLKEERVEAEPQSQAAIATGSTTAQKSAPSLDAQADGEPVAGGETDAAVANYAGAAFPNDGKLGSGSSERLDQPSTLPDMSTSQQETKQTTSAQPPRELEQTFAGTSDESLQPGSADARDPQQWIKDINDLLAQDKRAQAIDSLKAFRRKYPDYQLPLELRALLPGDSQ